MIKNQKILLLIFVVCFIVGIIYSYWYCSNMDNEVYTVEDAISFGAMHDYETAQEIIDEIPLNEKYEFCIYTTMAETIGVACVDISGESEYQIWQRESMPLQLIEKNKFLKQNFNRKSYSVNYAVSLSPNKAYLNEKEYDVSINGKSIKLFFSYQEQQL